MSATSIPRDRGIDDLRATQIGPNTGPVISRNRTVDNTNAAVTCIYARSLVVRYGAILDGKAARIRCKDPTDAIA